MPMPALAGPDSSPGPRHSRVIPGRAEVLRRLDVEFREAYGFGLPAAPAIPGEASRDGWSIERRRGGIGQSYVAEDCIEPPHHVLRLDGVTWMSDSLLELESHAWHVHRARGLVVVAGLGLGLYALAAAAAPGVERVVVAEIDPGLPVLLSVAGRTLPANVVVVEADVTSDAGIAALARTLGGRRPDYVYADIWPTYPDPTAPATTARLRDALGAAEAGWWGQEAALATSADEAGIALDEDAILGFARSVGVDVRPTSGYAEFCRQVGRAHGLRVDGPCMAEPRM